VFAKKRMLKKDSWDEKQENIGLARTLAAFLNVDFQPRVEVEDVSTIDGFREEHPDFFPQGWLEYEPTYAGGSFRKQWQIAHQFLREAWQSRFEIELYDYLKILQSIFNPDHLPALDPQWNGPHYRRWMGPPYRPAFADMWDMLWERDQTKPPYYLAIKFLSGNGWMAHVCELCGRYFVREHSQTTYCSYGGVTAIDGTQQKCAVAFRMKYIKDHWNDNKEEVNAGRRDDYADAKQKSVRDRKNGKGTRERKRRKR
jgi:hypothetical protein